MFYFAISEFSNISARHVFEETFYTNLFAYYCLVSDTNASEGMQGT